MILATDVYYPSDGGAIAAGVAFNAFGDTQPCAEFTCSLEEVGDYQSGEFYKRELPCLLQLLTQHQLKPSIIIVDGHVQFTNNPRPALGAHPYQTLGQQTPVIGVAKNPHRDISAKAELLRGDSLRPLYVSAVGIEIENAKQSVLQMHGPHRIPTLLKRADQLCRQSH